MSPTDANFDVDPFTRCESAIWKLLTEHDDFARLVKPGNMQAQAVGAAHPPNRSAAMPSDRPSATIVPAGAEDMSYTSTGVLLVQNYAVAIQCGKAKAAAMAFPLKWAAIRAVWAKRDLADLSFVTGLQLTAATEEWQEPESDEAAGLPGWNVALLFRVSMHFTNSQLT